MTKQLNKLDLYVRQNGWLYAYYTSETGYTERKITLCQLEQWMENNIDLSKFTTMEDFDMGENEYQFKKALDWGLIYSEVLTGEIVDEAIKHFELLEAAVNKIQSTGFVDEIQGLVKSIKQYLN